MTSVTTKKLQIIAAKDFKEAFSSNTDTTVGYVFIGNHTAWADEGSPPNLEDTVKTEKSIWDNMIAAKKVAGGDVELVIPRVLWTANTKYRQYDDTISFSTLLSANTTQNLKGMYVMTSEKNVYKCVSNAISSNGVTSNSTVMPTGDFTTSNGNIATSDGYIWKYMYNVKPSNKFLTADWMPVPESTAQFDYDVSTTGVVSGELVSIIVTANGSNYREASNIVVDSYASGTKHLNFSNTVLVRNIFSVSSLANLANMSISGTGIPTGTYISAIENSNGNISLSSSTTANGGGSNTLTQLALTTRVYINGDGTGAIANTILSNSHINASATQANISRIIVTTIGKNYTVANAYIYGSGSGATARVILPPKYGHAYNPSKELFANNVMVAVRIGEVDTTEGGKISANTNFRQYGLLINPHKYDNTGTVTLANANTVFVQTSNVTVLSGTPYQLDEYVFQGADPANSKAYGFVVDQDANVIKISNKFGSFSVGEILTGANSGTQRIISSSTNPELEPYTGDIIYAENVTKIDREDGQAENVKLIVRF
jgi:hypothetical protein